MTAQEAYLFARAYTNKAIEGGGSLKGAACQIKSIEAITGGHRITFEWEDNQGVVSTDTMDVMDGQNGSDGADGVGITSITKTGTSGLVDTYTITYTNGTTSTFTVTNGQDGDANEFIGTLEQWEALTTAQKKEYDTYQITNDYSAGSGLPNYSTTEQLTGQKWIDGRDIYVKTFNAGALPSSGNVTVQNDIANFGAVINVETTGISNDGYSFSNDGLVMNYASASAFVFRVAFDATGYNGYVTVYYVKTA